MKNIENKKIAVVDPPLGIDSSPDTSNQIYGGFTTALFVNKIKGEDETLEA